MSIAEQAIATTYPDQPSWLDGRKLGIGASDSAGIFGVGYASQSQFSIACDKLGLVQRDPEECERFECGHALQAGILQLASRRIGVPVYDPGAFTIYRSADFPWLAASLDGACERGDYGFTTVEAKNVDAFLAKDWRDDDEPPLKFQVQCQHQMAVMGTKHSFLVGLIGGNKVKLRHVARNDRFIEQTLVPESQKFWALIEAAREAIAAGESPVLPEVDGSEATARILAELHRNFGKDGSEVMLSPEVAEWVAIFEKAKEQAKFAEEAITEAKNHIVAAIGPATFGLLPNGTAYSYKQQSRAEYVCKASTFRVLRRMGK